MTDFYSQNRCVCSTRSHGPLLCAFCLSFHFKYCSLNSGGACLIRHNCHKIINYLVQAELTCISYLCFRESDDEDSSSRE